MECIDASMRDQISKTCEEKGILQVLDKVGNYLRRIENLELVTSYIFLRESEPLLQQGPQCGLVALTAALKTVTSATEITVQEVYETAKTEGFTTHGEMFSAENLAKLSNLKMPGSGKWLKCFDEKEKVNIIVASLLNSEIVLMPYDADGNHEPSLRKGHKAHWGAITGFVLITDRDSKPVVAATSFQHGSGLIVNVLNSSTSPEELILNASLESFDKLFVVCRQGKSKHLQVWPIGQLLASNANLTEVAPSILKAGSYIVPNGGIIDSLKDSLVVISGIQTRL